MSTEYKNTLFMPETNFDMKAGLSAKEPKFIEMWKKQDLYNKLASERSEEFILHDGPPYANGNIHVGHALNKIIKDFIVRNKTLEGKKVEWKPGWDTHGLPIEMMIQKKGIKLSEIGVEEYIKECTNYALEQVEIQQKQFERLALFTDFNQKYLTLMPKFESKQIGIFFKMLNKGLVYRDLKPVYWSWSSETALAEAEIEYAELEDPSIFVTFKHESGVEFMIWTTTPWTLPANVAVAVGEKINYSLVSFDNRKVIIASDLIESVSKTINKELVVEQESIQISEYINSDLVNPLNGKTSKLVYGHHVTTEGGTGIVHIAGGHGVDDYMVVKNNDLELFVVLNEHGHMINAGEYNDLFYKKASKVIIEDLTNKENLIHTEMVKHQVAIDWRTKKPVVYLATKQWFVSIEQLKEALTSEIKNVEWLPSWGEDRLIKMTEQRSDWCISRQRTWGVPIPIIYDSNGEPIINEELQTNIESMFAEKGTLGWHSTSIKDLLPESITFDESMRKEMDILDVWFDSGSSHEYILEGRQADVYLEGNDQYRGWFNSSLITSLVVNGKAPYKKVVTHGFVTDGKGFKMSKSKGNVIDPIKITDQYGADVLRLWVAQADFKDNIKISDDILKQVAKDYSNLRNRIRFTLSLLNESTTEVEPTDIISKAVLSNINNSFIRILKNYDELDFLSVVKEVMYEVKAGSIQYYFDYVKDIAYILKPDNIKVQEAQFVLRKILDYILYALAPILPTTVEEAWQNIGNKEFFRNVYPTMEQQDNSEWTNFSQIRNAVTKSIEILRQDGKLKTNVEASVVITLPEEYKNWSTPELKDYLQVAKVTIVEGTSLEVKSENFEGSKCQRCWRYFSTEDMSNDICKTCADIIS